MNMPEELQKIINDYARPLTRPDWRRGANFNINNDWVRRLVYNFLTDKAYRLANDNNILYYEYDRYIQEQYGEEIDQHQQLINYLNEYEN
jgi:hypothetical protein